MKNKDIFSYVTILLAPFGKLIAYVKFQIDRLRLKKLMLRGLKVGRNVYINESVEFDWGYPNLIEIGDNCRISKGVRVLVHDATTYQSLGVTKLAPVRILEGTFIGERAIILPGVTIGPRALIAAGAVVNRDIGENKVAAGNPARPYGVFSDLLSQKHTQALAGKLILNDDLLNGKITTEDLQEAHKNNLSIYIHKLPGKDMRYVNTNFIEICCDASQKIKQLQKEKQQN